MNPDAVMIEDFLKEVDSSFPTPLSRKQNLHEFANKLHEKATLCTTIYSGQIIALAAGYTENVVENRAYLSVVATITQAQGRGLASKLVKEFIAICKMKRIDAVHLYAVRSNTPAIKMYQKLGFAEWHIEDEPRPDDVHFIYYISKEDMK